MPYLVVTGKVEFEFEALVKIDDSIDNADNREAVASAALVAMGNLAERMKRVDRPGVIVDVTRSAVWPGKIGEADVIDVTP